MNPERTEPNVRVETIGASMIFDTNVVLQDVSVSVRAGETVGLIGENGAGKSTLMDIMCGVVRPTVGDVLIGGEQVSLHSPVDAAKRGIYRVFQEQSIIARLPVYVNLCLGAESHFSTFGVFRKHAALAHAREVLRELGLPFEVDRPAAD